MNIKKLGAGIAAGVLAAGMLTGCSLGRGGSLNLTSVNELLSSTELSAAADPKLDGVVAALAGSATLGMDQEKIAGEVASKMGWSIQGNTADNVLELLKSKLLGNNPELKVTYGTTFVVGKEELAAGVNPADLGLTGGTGAELLPIDSVDKVAAAVVLQYNAMAQNPIQPGTTYGLNWGNIGNIVGGAIDQGKDWVENNKDEINDAIDQGKDWVEDNKDEINDAIDKAEDAWNNNKDEIGSAVGELVGKWIHFTYHVSAYPMVHLDGSAWIVSVQVTAQRK